MEKEEITRSVKEANEKLGEGEVVLAYAVNLGDGMVDQGVVRLSVDEDGSCIVSGMLAGEPMVMGLIMGMWPKIGVGEAEKLLRDKLNDSEGSFWERISMKDVAGKDGDEDLILFKKDKGYQLQDENGEMLSMELAKKVFKAGFEQFQMGMSKDVARGLAERTVAHMMQGEGMSLNDEDRLRFRFALEKAGVKTEVYKEEEIERLGFNYSRELCDKGKKREMTTLGSQAAYVVEALGAERTGEIVSEVVGEMLGKPGGGVGEQKEVVVSFVKSYLENKFVNKDKKLGFSPTTKSEKWKKKATYRVEAVISVIDRLLFLTIPERSVNELEYLQADYYTHKYLLERIYRGKERAGKNVSDRVERLYDKKNLRHLPDGGLSLILGMLVS